MYMYSSRRVRRIMGERNRSLELKDEWRLEEEVPGTCTASHSYAIHVPSYMYSTCTANTSELDGVLITEESGARQLHHVLLQLYYMYYVLMASWSLILVLVIIASRISALLC
mmetsp:Transcript_19701/g.39992  ORF Transcript_19701/g.39992 Transcript_19701/m.39992 type:complete len:112 (+) Transcript_19701:349-684(+)